MIDHNGILLPTGWIDRPDDVAETCRVMQFAGHELDITRAAPHLFEADASNESVFLWEAEVQVLNRLLACWNQNPVGACVGFGATRAAQDVLLNEIASGEPEIWPGAELCPEVTYIGSRVEVNNGRSPIQPTRRDRFGDGSVGAWACQFLNGWGIVKRDRYGSTDLTRYDPAWVRANQFKGIPDEIEQEARQHPITTGAKLNSFADVWAALGARKGLYMCSRLGFAMQADAEGYAIPNDEWGHCMCWRGRFVHPRRGKSVIVQNSWRNPDGSVTWPGPNRVTVETIDRGPILLPEGCAAFTQDVVEAIVREQDSFALAGLSGWKRLKLTMDPYQ